MKRITIPLLMAMVPLLLAGQTSIYHPIPESGAMWREYVGGFQVNCLDYQLTVTGDTLINGTVFHKLQYFGVTHWTDYTGNCMSQFSGPYTYGTGAYRNDVPNRKVYYWSENYGEELLYDFNLSLDEKLPECFGYHYFMNMDTAFVSGIDSVMIEGEYHRRFAISQGMVVDYMYLVEGVGSTFGLLSQFFPPFESGSSLICFLMDSVNVYSPYQSDCNLVTGLRDPYDLKAKFSLYPNPAKEGPCRLSFPDSPGTYDIEVLNQTGRVVTRQKDVKPDAILDLKYLDNGVYFILLYKDQQPMYHTKLIIYR